MLKEVLLNKLKHEDLPNGQDEGEVHLAESTAWANA
jgi:hypothetical protein